MGESETGCCCVDQATPVSEAQDTVSALIEAGQSTFEVRGHGGWGRKGNNRTQESPLRGGPTGIHTSPPFNAPPQHRLCGRTGPSTGVPDPTAENAFEVDIAVFGRDAGGHERLLAIGEVKWKARMGRAHLTRLERIREFLAARDGVDATHTRLLCLSGDGFTDDLRTAATDNPELQLGDLDRLCNGTDNRAEPEVGSRKSPRGVGVSRHRTRRARKSRRGTQEGG
ncbi:hypothetical protein OG948_03015 [Embleya sp. NBC_00888]|uniref:hypothetical protein n=1 Tax=Embleya sp. NBC_00888 TaxID=2975960 RepID=UPI003867E18F|nr:hypothetical protein OG948_03015 [Embleya sp. NBC_00888]